jgi:RNA polymerase I-specific transcription initiation factor RRN6
MVLMHSRLTPLIMVYRFQDSSSNVSLTCSSSDPTILRLEKDLLESMEIVRHISHLNVEQLRYEGGHKHYEADAGHVYFNNDVRFYRLSAMLSDLSVHQLILYSHEPEISTAAQMRLVVKPLGWATIVHPRRRMLMETLIDVDDDNFVVQDGIEASTMPKIKKPYQTPKIVKDLKTTASQSAGAVVNLGYLYDALTSNEAALEGENVEVESKDVSVVIDHVKSLLVADVDAKEIPRETLMGFAGHKINVLDIDESSSRLYDLCTHEPHTKPVELRYIASPQALHILTSNHDEHDLTMSFLYDTFLQYWIAPLPVNFPARVRQSKEKLARRIAAEVLLASMRIRHAEPYTSTEQMGGSQVGMSWESGPALPTLPSVREESGPDDIEIASSQPWWPSSQLLPAVPSSSSLPTLASPSTLSTPNHSSALPTFSSSISQRPSNPITRLSQHLQINNPPPDIRQGVGKVLAHWTPGSDPSTYDWEATTQSLDQEEDEESQQQREKAKRKQERLKKRQRREEAIARGRGGMESQPPYALDQLSVPQFPRSSPGPGIGGMGEFDVAKMGGSSQSHSQGMPFIQSQVEPGRHGGRPVKKKKKLKVRVSGF